MKSSTLLALVATTLFPLGALAQNTMLFSTENDFSGWTENGGTAFTESAVTSPDLDGLTVNGLGNTSAPGATGTAGSLSLQWVSGSYDDAAYSPGEQGNSAFLNALESASALTFDFTTPTTGVGTYYQLGIVLNYTGNFDQLFPATTSSLGGGVTQATVNWTSEASKLASQQATDGGSFSYFQLGIIYNSDYTPSTPFNVDSIAVTPAPEPASLALLGLGAAGLFLRRRSK